MKRKNSELEGYAEERPRKRNLVAERCRRNTILVKKMEKTLETVMKKHDELCRYIVQWQQLSFSDPLMGGLPTPYLLQNIEDDEKENRLELGFFNGKVNFDNILDVTTSQQFLILSKETREMLLQI